MLYTPICPRCGMSEITIKDTIKERIVETENSQQLIRTLSGICENCHHEFEWDENYFLDSITSGTWNDSHLIQEVDGTITSAD